MSTKVFLYQYVTGEEEIVWVFAFYSLNSQKWILNHEYFTPYIWNVFLESAIGRSMELALFLNFGRIY